MNQIINYIQRRNLHASMETIDKNHPQQTKRCLYQEHNNKPFLQNLHHFDGEKSTDVDLISYDGDKEDSYSRNDSEDTDSGFDSCSRILKAVKERTITKNLQGVGEKLHREALETITIECKRVIEDAVHEALEEAQKVKAKAVQDALKEYADENEEYIRQLKKQHQGNLEEQIARTQQKAQEEIEKRIEEEKQACEYRVKLAMEEAQKHFREHLKTAVQEAQEAETRMGEDKFRQMKREFEEKLRELTRVVAEEKQKVLLRQQRELQKEQEKAVEEMRKEEEERTTEQLKLQEKEYKNIIIKMEGKLGSRDQETQHLVEKLNESVAQKSEVVAEITRVRGQLQQFLKLAAAAGNQTTQKRITSKDVIW